VFVSPIIGYRGIKKNFKNLQDKTVKFKYGMFYKDNRTDTIEKALYNIYFLNRRFFSVVIIIFMMRWPFFQCVFLMIFSMINLSYMVAIRPLCSAKENRIEIFNEAIIYTCCNIMTTFLNVAMPLSLRDQLGWVFISVASLNIFTNLIITCIGSLKNMWDQKKHKKFTKRAESAL